MANTRIKNIGTILDQMFENLSVQMEENNGHSSEEVLNALDVLEDALTADNLSYFLANEVERLNFHAYRRSQESFMDDYSARRLTVVNGLCYSTDNSELACSTYLFDQDYPVLDPDFATDSSGVQTEESSHKAYREWFENCNFFRIRGVE